MSVLSDAAEIRVALEEVELHVKTARRAARKLHNLMATALASHGELLGLDESEVTALGGGTDKPPLEAEGG